MNDYEHLLPEDYETLYARYLEHPGRLMYAPDPAVPLTEKTRLLDLCAGSGALIRVALKVGLAPNNIVAVEESQPFAGQLHRLGSIHVIHGTVTYLPLFEHLNEEAHPFDLITCRQAVNYWWGCEIAVAACNLLRKGGCFVFNTFNTPCDPVPRVKQYTWEGKEYAEIAYQIGGVVHHVQACEGLPMHTTTFRWVPPEEFDDDLAWMVSMNVIENWTRTRNGYTDTYVLRAKVY